MITQQTPFLLKVLSGSNAGALVRLKVGELVIGRSMSSDIILHDKSVADSHLRLKVSEDVILMEVLAQPLHIDNREIEAKELILKPFQVVTVGSVDFFIADVRKPGRRSTENESGVEPEVLYDKSQTFSADTLNTQHNAGAIDIGSPVKRPKRGGKKFLWLGLSLLILANVLYFLPDILNLAEKAGFRESSAEKVETVVSALDVEGLTVEKTEQDAVISGYVDTLQEKRRIMTRIGRIGGDINYRIWASEELVSNAERVAHALGQSGISFRVLKDGRLAANGYVSSIDAWERIKANIMDDVNGIQAIDDDEIQTLIKRKVALEQFIEKKGLSSRVRVTIVDNRINVDGELTQSELNRWSDLYQEFLELNGKGPAIVENLHNARDRIKLVIRSVSVGETPFLVSKDGKKYMEGSNLGNNYFIKKITPDHVLLSNDGVEIPIYYGVEDK